jgi:AraC-like DNA-binding protein
MFNEILLGDALDKLDVNEDDYILAPQKLRSAKNGVICVIAVTCRQAADLGADDVLCYALSDYYICLIEQLDERTNWKGVIIDIFRHYIALIVDGRLKSYSLPIRKAIQYIEQHLYEKCSLSVVAAAIERHPNYLTTKFKAEVGVLFTDYITGRKMEEAKSLLQNTSYSISEIAEMLGFNSLSYFAKRFRGKYSLTPKEFREAYVAEL